MSEDTTTTTDTAQAEVTADATSDTGSSDVQDTTTQDQDTTTTDAVDPSQKADEASKATEDAEEGDDATTTDKDAFEFKAEDYDLNFGEDTSGEDDGGISDRFKEMCVDQKITPEMAQKVIDFQMKEMAEASEALITAGETTLRKTWGNNYDTNREQGLVALQALDKRMDGRLAPALKNMGGANDPVIVETLYTISTLIGEDNLGGSKPSGADDKPVSTKQAYEKLWKGKT